MGMNKAHAQTENIQEVYFTLVDTAGTPSIANVCPRQASVDISVVDTAQGQATVTIKNFKGVQGATCVQCTPRTTSLMVAVESRAYSGDNLSFVIHIENDASTDTDSSVDVWAAAY